MRWPALIRAFGSLVLAGLLTSAAFAGSVPLVKGQPAPYDGLLFDAEAAQAVVEYARDAGKYRSDTETLLAQVATFQAQVKDLREAAADFQATIRLHAQSDAVRDVIEARMATTLAATDRALGMMERAGEIAIKAAAQSTVALEKANDKIEAANQRGFWGTALAFVVGIFAGPAAAAFIR